MRILALAAAVALLALAGRVRTGSGASTQA